MSSTNDSTGSSGGTPPLRKIVYACSLAVAVLAVGTVTQPVAHAGSLNMPDWEGLFDSTGARVGHSTPGLSQVEFIHDNISAGIAVDMSALLPGEKFGSQVLFNGLVAPAHDLGNAAVAFSGGKTNTRAVYATVERLSVGEPTYIEFEFLQYPVSYADGAPWSLDGQRLEGDLKAVMHFGEAGLASVDLMQFDGAKYRHLERVSSISASGCGGGDSFSFCTGLSPFAVSGAGFDVWDENDQVIDRISADERVELGIDTRSLAKGLSYDSVIIRTPQDLALRRSGLNLREPVAHGSAN